MVARFRSAAGEHDFVGLRSEKFGQLPAAILDGRLGVLSVGMGARRVAELGIEKGMHRLPNLRIDRRRGVNVAKRGGGLPLWGSTPSQPPNVAFCCLRARWSAAVQHNGTLCNSPKRY
jgi:hypothetical protein